MNADFLTRYITTNRLEFVNGTKFNESVAIVPTITGSEETSGSATFSFTFGFAWGDAYDNLNPSIFTTRWMEEYIFMMILVKLWMN